MGASRHGHSRVVELLLQHTDTDPEVVDRWAGHVTLVTHVTHVTRVTRVTRAGTGTARCTTPAPTASSGGCTTSAAAAGAWTT